MIIARAGLVFGPRSDVVSEAGSQNLGPQHADNTGVANAHQDRNMRRITNTKPRIHFLVWGVDRSSVVYILDRCGALIHS